MERMWRTALAILLCLASAGLPAPAAADAGALGRSSETVFPISEPAVRMDAEAVNLVVDPKRTRTDATFTFTNTGPVKRQVLMGFPVFAPDERGRDDRVLHDFAALVDGAPVPVRQEEGVAPLAPWTFANGSAMIFPAWITWTVAFEPGQTRTVRNTFWSANSFWAPDQFVTGYVLRTGAPWQGAIGKAVVRAKLDGLLPGDLTQVKPATYRWEGDSLVWEWTELEPERDIEIYWNGGDQDPIRRMYLDGQKEQALVLAAEALAEGRQDPTVLYIAVKEGLRTVAEIPEWKAKPPMERWLKATAGVAGSGPTVSLFSFNGFTLRVGVADPDGDLAAWGVEVRDSPDESRAPIYVSPPGGEMWRDGETGLELLLPVADPPGPGEVWVKTWAVDGQNHRFAERVHVVNNTLPHPAPPESEAPATGAPEAPAPAAPGASATGEEARPFQWLPLLGLMAALLLAGQWVRFRKR